MEVGQKVRVVFRDGRILEGILKGEKVMGFYCYFMIEHQGRIVSVCINDARVKYVEEVEENVQQETNCSEKNELFKLEEEYIEHMRSCRG